MAVIPYALDGYGYLEEWWDYLTNLLYILGDGDKKPWLMGYLI